MKLRDTYVDRVLTEAVGVADGWGFAAAHRASARSRARRDETATLAPQALLLPWV